ncbi:site-2 protease family protein [Streptomyces sp.]|uniref:site-2 protease family protein n=1 Tax=Streptomyces sp. TaxID=1931 RepID=UPI002D4973C2|nr:site-2 protease family protein [Streptomyces sp.]HZF91389.1 site-2 protease family protein [Streptomyces sp.]
MDESGGSGQPRSGNDNSTDHAPPAAPAPHPTPDPTQPAAAGTAGPPDEPAHRQREAPPEQPPPATRDTGPAEHPAAPADQASAAATAAAPDGQPPRPDSPAPSADATPGAGAARRPGTAPGEAPAPGAAQAPGACTPSAADGDPGADKAPGPGTAPGPDGSPAVPDSGAATAPTPPAPGPRPAARPSQLQVPRMPQAPQPARPDRPVPADHHPPTGVPGGGPHPGDHDRTHAHSGAKGAPQRPEPGGGLLMGRPFGVPVYVAPSWFLVAILITWVFGGQLDRVLPELGAARYLVSLFFAVAFYASVLVHELAHTIAALRFKLPVRRIQLQFFGGVSEIEKEAETPGREFVLAFVGPLLSLVLAGVFYLAMQPVEPGTVPGVLLAGLMISNLIVAAFNLLPGLPLDGGRMLRAVVWKITGKPMSGTVAAAWIGRALAVSVLIGLPLLTQSGALGADAEDNVGMDTVLDALLAAILAAIIWTGAGNSLRVARLREHLPELRARALTRRAVPVRTDTPLSEALRRANDAGARALVVVDADGTPVSLVREAAIVGVPEHRRPWVAVSGLAQELTDGMRVSAELAGEDLLETLRAHPATEYLVVEETGEIYGVLSAADVERAFVKAMARPS